MRKLAILTFMTLDGVMQAPADPAEDRSGDFAHGGWAKPWWSEVMEQVQEEAMAEPYDMLLGRRTYEIFAPHWSRADGADAATLNQAKKYVASSTLTDVNWMNSTVLSGDVPAEIQRLKAANGPLLQVHGSWGLIQTLLEHDLIDEFRLWVFPLTLGSGKRLFSSGTPPENLKLLRARETKNGVRMGIYEPVQ